MTMDEGLQENNSKYDEKNYHHDVIPKVDKPWHVFFKIFFPVAHSFLLKLQNKPANRLLP
jgi:hypothetical protein